MVWGRKEILEREKERGEREERKKKKKREKKRETDGAVETIKKERMDIKSKRE